MYQVHRTDLLHPIHPAFQRQEREKKRWRRRLFKGKKERRRDDEEDCSLSVRVVVHSLAKEETMMIRRSQEMHGDRMKERNEEREEEDAMFFHAPRLTA